MGLIDEYRIYLHPAGSGKARAFSPDRGRRYIWPAVIASTARNQAFPRPAGDQLSEPWLATIDPELIIRGRT
jgi:hypothetical protein